MKNTICVLLVIGLLASLTGCGGADNISSEDSVSSAILEPVQKFLSKDDLKSLLAQQMEEIQNAIADIAPAQKLSTDAERETITQKVADSIAGLGFPVVQDHNDMPNYELVTAFLEQAQKGEDAFVAIFSVNVYEGISVNGTLYGRDETRFYSLSASISQDDNFSWAKNIYDATQLTSLELTANGNLMENADDQGMGYGFRVVPLSKEYTDAYWKYVWLVDVQADGILSNAWNMKAGFRELPWEFIFEEIWERENKKTLIAEDNPYYTQIETDYSEDYVAVVPADVVESTLHKYFDVDAAVLREMTYPYGIGNGAKLYNPNDNTYTIWGFRGGGYKPTVEVWGITNNPDGSISLDLANVALEFGNDGKISSTLTVMPRADGSFKYISNISSENNIKGKVEYALSLAESADIIHQGAIAVTDESIEQNGYRFAAMDDEKTYQGKMKLGGLSSTDSIKSWFNILFEKEAADKYIQQMFDAPLYIDGTKDGEEELFVNQDIKGSPIAQGVWAMEDFAVIENTPDRITVQMRFDTADGSKVRALTLVPGERRRWVLTDSYEGLRE